MTNLEKAHELNRILMRKLDSICKEYGITYYYDSGALLGAVRHQDFIPWDDDIDIAFTRENYNKLLAVPKSAWGDDFELVLAKDLIPDSFFDFPTRLVYLGDSVPLQSYAKVENHVPEKYKDRMVLDCFILDNAYDSQFKQLMLRLRLTMIYGQCMGHRDSIDYSEYGTLQKIVIGMLAAIGKHKSLNKLREKYERVSMSVKGNTNHYYYSNYPMPDLKAWCDKEWFNGTVDLKVGDDYFSCPKGYKEILTMVYGDYMKLPPEESRVPMHVKPDAPKEN
ncbi:MAG: LicD family protein [Eubacteriales bacterium]|nr:LicD family protein [Eubacteriales bacterium]